jgi:diacylglycerol kinase family enzyme
MLTYDFPEIALQWDDHNAQRLKIATVCVANGPSFGGGMKIAPDAKLDDGSFDVVVIGDMKLPQMILNSHRLYTGTFLSLEKTVLIRARKVNAEPMNGRDEVLLEVDGETPGRLPASFEILPSALRIRC